MKREAVLVRVTGIVQGVGFRPFIHRLAIRIGLKGYVKNMGGADVEIYLEGSENQIKEFLKRLKEEQPPTARLKRINIIKVKPKGYTHFVILPSGHRSNVLSMIPPDFSICEHCLREILDPGSRWYKYPFNACAWCGPRFTIIERLPYDRENTSMRDFPLCAECLSEYNDPFNERRFHAQGISCPHCGPKVFLMDSKGELIECKDPISLAAKLIDEGNIVAVKGIGGFHIAALANDDDVVLELRKRKRRPQKPFAIMAMNLEIAKKLIVVDNLVQELLLSYERPIVVAPAQHDAPISKLVAPGLDMLGVMLAYTGLHYLLLARTKDRFLIMTSGNPKGQPICIREEEALSKIGDIVDYFLIHNRRIINRADDSVVRISDGKVLFLRRSRGYVPLWIELPLKLERLVISLGAYLANVVAVGIKHYAIPSQYIGDMENLETLEFAEHALKFLIKAYALKLKEPIIVTDMNPAYPTLRLAREWAERYEGDLVLVQHHHAHIMSVATEYGIPLDTEVIGIAIDGAGYGLDGNIWGGEILKATYSSFRRIGHLCYQSMPGGDRATIYPVRMLIGILSSFMDEDEIVRFIDKQDLMKGLPLGNYELKVTIQQATSSAVPKTSSTGRFLDSISALLGVCLKRTYEGEPAMKLEAYAHGGKILDVKIRIDKQNDQMVLDTSKLMEELIGMLGEVDKRSIAATAQYSLGLGLGLMAREALSRRNAYVIISGGAAVNEYILKGIKDSIGDKAKILLPKQMPPGDGGICLGQIMISYAQTLKN